MNCLITKINLKPLFIVSLFIIVLLAPVSSKAQCLIGAFLEDQPTSESIQKFKQHYGKKPGLVLLFLDWNSFINEQTLQEVYSQDSTLLVTLEPWFASKQQGIDYQGLLKGKYDSYLKKFAAQLKDIKKEVWFRFAHEMNGNWYPWSGTLIGKKTYIACYQYIYRFFEKEKVKNTKWVFAINCDSVPKRKNHFSLYYPGNKYVDYIGIDGYNWGQTQSWSHWKSFDKLFNKSLTYISKHYNKPIIISEFSSTSHKGNKAKWIQQALTSIQNNPQIKAFVLFNINKETDWYFSPKTQAGKTFRRSLKNPYFVDTL